MVSIVRKKTHEEFVNEVKESNPNIVILGHYEGANTKVLCLCLKHNVEWYARPSNIIKGSGCPICKKEKYRIKRVKTEEFYKQELSLNNPNIELIGHYEGMRKKALHRCIVHDYEWYVFPNNVLKGHGCPICLREKIRDRNIKTNEKYVKDLGSANPNIISLEEYKGAETNILHKCLKCGNEWMVRPSNLLSGKGCPNCKKSNGELLVKEWLDNHTVNYKTQYMFEGCRNIRPLPFDFYLLDYNACIEYQGEQHYRAVDFFGGEEGFVERQRNDNIKRKFCKDNDIRLLEIPFDKDVNEELSNFLFI